MTINDIVLYVLSVLVIILIVMTVINTNKINDLEEQVESNTEFLVMQLDINEQAGNVFAVIGENIELLGDLVKQLYS